MSAFECFDVDEDAPGHTVEAESPITAAESWVTWALAHGREARDTFDVLVVDQAERQYVVTISFIEHPQEWAERIGEPGVWRAQSWRSEP
jgi:hypothetical protein